MMSDQASRDDKVRHVILIEGAANVLVLIVKLAVGISTGSLAILGDAIHSFSDAVNNLIALVVVKHSKSPPDRKHPYGHRKFETLSVFFLASLLVILAFELALSAIKNDTTEIVDSGWGFNIMLAVMAVNISLAVWQRMWANRLQSDILFADASHTFADVLTTVVVIAGWQLSVMGYPWLDRACAIGVSIIVLYLAYSLFRRAFPILVDQFALDPEMVATTVKEVDGVRQVRRVRSRWIGKDVSVDLIISVDPELSTFDSHDIATEVEAHLGKQFGVSDVSIHVEPS